MADYVPVQSNYVYTENVRLFKENDPYFWKVDNIPLEQLAENTNWLKDQLVGKGRLTGVTRADFDELRPYTNGDDRVVRVKPGRYSARVNDAYDKTPLQFFLQAAGTDPATNDILRVFASNSGDVVLGQILDQFKTQLAANTANMNGLAERAFTYPVADSDYYINDFDTDEPTTTLTGSYKPPFPLSEILLWVTGKSNQYYDIQKFRENRREAGHVGLSRLEVEFARKWRGTARTAIVDVPEELDITVPKFNSNDYFYYDASGGKQSLGASQRIDLVFIYSKPVDTSAVTIGKYNSGSPTKITKPELGIVLGAGVGLDFEPVSTSIEVNYEPIEGVDSEGNALMLADVSDEINTNNGFSGINVHGSFPSPDDLMNISPLLDYKLSQTSLALVGQSILPVAYIVTRDTSGVLGQSDVIDIRPLMRTAELAFNERAGIAAAMPQLSYANPAVGKAQMDQELFKLDEKIQNQLDALSTVRVTTPRVVAAGHVFGGFNFGVEGTYKDFINQQTNATLTSEEIKRLVKVRQGLNANTPIPDFPDWDTARWIDLGSFSEKGLHLNDYINTIVRDSSRPVDYGNLDSDLVTVINTFGTDNKSGEENLVNIHFVKKTINLDRDSVQWMQDYMVNVDFLSCIPLSCRSTGVNPLHYAGAHGIWIEKSYAYFSIYVAWVANDNIQGLPGTSETKVAPGGGTTDVYPQNNRDGHYFTGFAALNLEMFESTGANPVYLGQTPAGVATYPSVAFSVVGIPGSFQGYGASMNGRNPTLKLY